MSFTIAVTFATGRLPSFLPGSFCNSVFKSDFLRAAISEQSAQESWVKHFKSFSDKGYCSPCNSGPKLCGLISELIKIVAISSLELPTIMQYFTLGGIVCLVRIF